MDPVQRGRSVLGNLSSSDSWRSLLAGIIYLLLCVLGSQGVWRIGLWLEHRASPGSLRLRFWSGWPFWGRISSLALAVVFLFVMLMDGTFAADDVGLRPITESVSWAWLAGLTLGLAAWLALLWGGYWRRNKAPDRIGTQPGDELTCRYALLHVLHQGASSAILRAALIPVGGAYWGVWLAALARLLVLRTNPEVRARLKKGGQREFIYLDRALDWISATLFVVSGSAWPALSARAIGYFTMLALYKRMAGRRPSSRASAKAMSADN